MCSADENAEPRFNWMSAPYFAVRKTRITSSILRHAMQLSVFSQETRLEKTRNRAPIDMSNR